MSLIRIGNLVLNEDAIISVNLNHEYVATFYCHPHDLSETFFGVEISVGDSAYGDGYGGGYSFTFFGDEAKRLREYFSKTAACISEEVSEDPIQKWKDEQQAVIDGLPEEQKRIQQANSVPF